MSLFELSSTHIDGYVVCEVGQVGGVSLVHSENKGNKGNKGMLSIFSCARVSHITLLPVI